MPHLVLFVRHPSYFAFESGLLDNAGQFDINLPLSRTGAVQARLVAEHLATFLRRFPKASVQFFSSNYRRAKSLAKVTLSTLQRRAVTDRLLPSFGKGLETVPEFGEVHFGGLTKAEYADLLNKDITAFDEFTIEHPEKIVPDWEKKRKSLPAGLARLQKSKAQICVVFTHRMTLAALLWDARNRSRGREQAITTRNFGRLFPYTSRIGHTSITPVSLQPNGQLRFTAAKLGTRPHLSDQKLITGLSRVRRTYRRKTK